MKIHPIADSTVSFGVVVEDFNPDVDFDELQALVFEKLVVVVRNQSNLSPTDQYNLTKRFDPDSESYGHGHNQKLMSASVLQNDLISIPSQPQVKLLGNGPCENHEGIATATLKHPQHFSFHKNLLTDEETAAGFTRFFRWHMDAALYKFEPPIVTTLLALKVPVGKPQTIRYDDGTDDIISDVPPGATAFVSGEAAYDCLPENLKERALKCQVKYAPHPYIWIKNAKALSNGLGLVSEGLELPMSELPPYEEDLIRTYPLVWKNTVNGKYSLQAHGCCVLDLIIDGKSVGDLAKSRELLYEMMRPGIAPARVYVHDWREGDLVIFSNRSLWHSVTGTLAPDICRVYHQCNLAGSFPPSGVEKGSVLGKRCADQDVDKKK